MCRNIVRVVLEAEHLKQKEMGNVLVRRCRARNGCRYNHLEEERARGQQALRNLVANKTVDEVEWEVLIQTAEDLHRREQRRLRKRERKWRRRQRRKSKSLRRKYSNDTGVYCINLLSHEGNGSSYVGEDAEFYSEYKIDIQPLESQTFDITSLSDKNIRETSSSSAEDDTKSPAPASAPALNQQEAISMGISPISMNASPPSTTTTTTIVGNQQEQNIACIESSTNSTLYLLDASAPPRQANIPPRARNSVDRPDPIDMVDLISKYCSSDDDDDDEDEENDDSESTYGALNHQELMSTLLVNQNVSRLTDETDSYEKDIELNRLQVVSALRGSFPRKVFFKSLAPDGSHQITL